MDDPKKLYSLEELFLWLEEYFLKEKEVNGWVGNRPFQYVKYGRLQLKRAQQSMYLTVFGVGTLAFLAGFGICWIVFVR